MDEYPFSDAFLQEMQLVWPASRSYAEAVLTLDAGDRPSHMWGFVNDRCEPLFAFGALPYWPGVAEMWMVVDVRMRHSTYMRRVVRLVEAKLAGLQEHWYYHRLFAQFDISNDQSRKMVKLLGFEEEGILRGYGIEGEDFVMTARVH